MENAFQQGSAALDGIAEVPRTPCRAGGSRQLHPSSSSGQAESYEFSRMPEFSSDATTSLSGTRVFSAVKCVDVDRQQAFSTSAVLLFWMGSFSLGEGCARGLQDRMSSDIPGLC